MRIQQHEQLDSQRYSHLWFLYPLPLPVKGNAMTTLSPAQLADVLASGKYNKTKGTLMQKGGYCCLGVYAAECDILCVDGNRGFVYSGKEGQERPEYDELGSAAPGWMLETATDPILEMDGNIDGILINLNDESEDWSSVIEFLRSL